MAPSGKNLRGRSVENEVTNVYAKFRNFTLRINKALGIFRKRVTTPTRTSTRTRTTVAAIRDALQRPIRSYDHR